MLIAGVSISTQCVPTIEFGKPNPLAILIDSRVLKTQFLMLWLQVGESLLRTRGGISAQAERHCVYYRSSPHTRRYFPPITLSITSIILFSAHAEVFPRFTMKTRWRGSLLRTRGGISTVGIRAWGAICSSPHTRRYFPK